METMICGDAIYTISESEVKRLNELKYKDYLSSSYWKEVRKRIIEIYGYQCEICGCESGIQVHHLHYANKGKETFEELMCLCGNCHSAIHTHSKRVFLTPLYDRSQVKKIVDKTLKVKKKFSNEQYIKYLPLVRVNAMWTLEKLSALWGCTIEEVEKEIKVAEKQKIVLRVTSEIGKEKIIWYTIDYFMWYMLEFYYPDLDLI